MRKGKERKEKGRNKKQRTIIRRRKEGKGKKGTKNVQGRNGLQWVGFVIFFLRERDFPLKSRLIRPSDFFGPKRKVVLHIEDYTWAPVSGVFDKLCEVGVLS